MELYHISTKQYSLGDKVSVASFSGNNFYHEGLPPLHKKVDCFLSKVRPEGEPARDHCIYAFKKKEYCVYFRKDDILGDKRMHLYRCEMNSKVGHPMIIVGKIDSQKAVIKNALRSEYWYPTQGKLLRCFAKTYYKCVTLL